MLMTFEIDPCTIYRPIKDTTRSIYSEGQDRILSDIDMVDNKWYRFDGPNSQFMVTYPVDMLQCGTVSPGWLATSHPPCM